MATELGSAYISVGLATNSLAGDIKKAFGGVDSQGSAGGKKAGAGFASGFKALVGPALALVSTAAIGGFVKDSIAAAGDLEQSVGAIDAVFKGSADQMHGWAKSAANDVGLTANEFNELGTLIGAQLKNGGTAMEDLAPKTNELVNLGADMASMFGGSTADAVGALSSALKGERDPIEAYGVSLKQASIDAKAAEMGFEKVGGSLSDEAQQAATLALIMEQTSDAHGNFAKESSTYAGQVQRLSAGWGDLKSSIGTLFLPVMTQAVSLINSAVMPALGGFVDMIGSGGLAGAFGPLAGMASELWAGLTMPADLFAGLSQTGELSGLVAIGAAVGDTFRQVAEVFATAWDSLGPSISALVPQVLSLLASFSPLGMIFKLIAPFLPQIAGMLTQVASAVTQVLGVVIPLAQSILAALMPVFMQLVATVLPPVITTIGMLVAALSPLITTIASLLIPIINALLPVVQTVFGVIGNIITAAMTIIQGVIQVVTGIITGNWSMAWDGIVSILTGAVDLVSSIVGGIKDIVLSALSGAGSWLLETGANIVQGLIDGISSLAGTVGQFFLDLLPGWIVGPFKAALGIHSPSKVFAGFGENIGEGVLQGVGKTENKIDRTMGGLVNVPSVPSIRAGAFEPARPGVGAGAAGGPAVQQIIQPAPGMSEHTIGRIAADSLNYQLRGAH